MEKTTVRKYKKRTTVKPTPVETETPITADVPAEEKMSAQVEEPEEEVKVEGGVPPEVEEKEEHRISDEEIFGQKHEEKAGSKLFKVSIFVLLLLLLANVAFFFFFIKDLKKSAPVETAAITPTPTPAPTINKSEWTFEVLNGSGVAGAASKVADALTSAGYTVVETGNADLSDYEQTQIYVKNDLKDKVDLLIADLKDIVKIATVAGELTDSTASARIILGKDQ